MGKRGWKRKVKGRMNGREKMYGNKGRKSYKTIKGRLRKRSKKN